MPTSYLAHEILGATNLCSAFNLLMTDMASALGGGPEAYVFLYVMLFMFPLVLIGGITRNAIIGLLGATGGHVLVLLLGTNGCMPLPTEYWIVGNFVYLMVAGVFFYIWKAYDSGRIRY